MLHMAKLCPLLLVLLQLLSCRQVHSKFSNGFFYQDIMNANNSGEIYLNGVKLRVEAQQQPALGLRGRNVTLPCSFWYEPPLSSPRRVRVKWSRVPLNGDQESDVLVSVGLRQRTFGDFKERVHLQQDYPGDISLVIRNISLNDSGQYRCEVIDGLEDESATVDLELRGVVFPYQPPHGRYHMSFPEARQACEQQDSSVASFEQLYWAWQEGLDWCNAGWLADGTVQYPITRPRRPCGGQALGPGVRSYGVRHKHKHYYDVFCFSSTITGRVYFLQHSQKLNFTESVKACIEDGAQIAKVGQLYAAWRFLHLDRCDSGWLADGSVRYPITSPRPNCGPQEPGVRSFGFPSPHHKHGVYCYSSTP